jgi:hypothetical protein
VDGKKRFLHDVLWIDAALPCAATRKAANERGRVAEKFRIGPFVTLEGGFQQPRKLGFLIATHQNTPSSLRQAASLRLAVAARNILHARKNVDHETVSP